MQGGPRELGRGTSRHSPPEKPLSGLYTAALCNGSGRPGFCCTVLEIVRPITRRRHGRMWPVLAAALGGRWGGGRPGFSAGSRGPMRSSRPRWPAGHCRAVDGSVMDRSLAALQWSIEHRQRAGLSLWPAIDPDIRGHRGGPPPPGLIERRSGRQTPNDRQKTLQSASATTAKIQLLNVMRDQKKSESGSETFP